MRFIYGFILGVLVSVVSAILYLAFTGGDYLLQLSPRYHEMVSTIESLREAKGQRDELASRLDTLTESFDDLTRRFNQMQGTERAPGQVHEGPAATRTPTASAPANP